MGKLNKRQIEKLADIKNSYTLLHIKYKSKFMLEREYFEQMEGLEVVLEEFINQN